LIAFLIETIKLPSACSESKKVETHACCKMKSMQNGACAQKQQQNSNPGDCNHSTKCVDCPLCSLFAGQQLNNLSLQPTAFAKEYSILQIHALADYYNREWKPPNCV